MMHGFLTFCCVSRSEVFNKNVSENVSVYFLGGHGDRLDSPFTALLASNLLAQFSRQIVIQILGLELPKVCGNLAVYVHFRNSSACERNDVGWGFGVGLEVVHFSKNNFSKNSKKFGKKFTTQFVVF
jgi:hypothetical protein